MEDSTLLDFPSPYHRCAESGCVAVQVVSVSVNPVDCNLVLSAGNDHMARITDLRVLSSSPTPSPGAKGALLLCAHSV